MASRPGEENVVTLFGDIHYFYGPDTVKPRHHRFDKGSYVYLFENAQERRCRIEIANQPGADEQDAFDGFLDHSRVRYSYKQHCMVTLTVPNAASEHEWHLPTFDPKNERKYHYKLHSLDIYFWTQRDALQFVNGVRRVLPASQLEILDEPGPPASQSATMSAVVQKLENAAISDPQYSNAQQQQQQTQSAPRDVTHSVAATTSTESSAGGQAPAKAEPQFEPMAYNPAAPAAPETIQHREKTPPPDEDPLNPLAVAVAYDYQKQPFTPGYPQQAQFPPGVLSPGLPPSVTSPGLHPQHPGMQRAATMPAQFAGMQSPGLASPYGSGFPASPGLPPPPGPPPGQPQVQAHQQQPGGYSAYSYAQPGPQAQTGPQGYAIHQQFYRPAEGDIPGHHKPRQENKVRLEESAAKLERGVNGMLKKFEKRFG